MQMIELDIVEVAVEELRQMLMLEVVEHHQMMMLELENEVDIAEVAVAEQHRQMLAVAGKKRKQRLRPWASGIFCNSYDLQSSAHRKNSANLQVFRQ